jgi:lambda family phage portal protein
VLWQRWCYEADAAGLSDSYGLQSLVVRNLVEAGEAFVRFRPRLPNGLAVPLQLQLLDPGQVDPALHRDLGNGNRIRSGVELDPLGARVAFHIFPDVPGDPFNRALTPVRIDASEVLHIFEPLAPGQQRGLSWLTPTLLRLHELGQYEDAQLVRQKVAALFAGFLMDPDGNASSAFAGDTSSGVMTSGLEPGTLKVLPPGYDIKFSDPADTGDNYEPFIDQQLRSIAAGLGITFEQLTGDMTGVNYSSARVALIEFRRRVEALQQQVIVHQLCRPVWDRFISMAVLSGALPETAIRAPVRWVPPAWDWVDPLKDAQAEQLAVEAGFKSRSQVIVERGRDPDKVLAEIAEERAAAEAAGVSFDVGVNNGRNTDTAAA